MTMPAESDWERIYSASYGPFLELHAIRDAGAGTAGLEVTADVLDNEVTLPLDLDGVVKLRRALQRHERRLKRQVDPQA